MEKVIEALFGAKTVKFSLEKPFLDQVISWLSR